ncbi:MAG: GNAT family N-acetyltransferase [Pseudomonadota bacterium]
MSQFTFRHLTRMADIPREEWMRVFDGATESFDYFSACEEVPPIAFQYSAIGIFRDDKLMAGAPIFKTRFDPGVVLDGPVKTIYNGIATVIPAIGNVPIVGLGSPHSQEPTIAFDPALSAAERQQALECLIAGLDSFAASVGARLTLLKDVGDQFQDWAHPGLEAAGYANLTALPVATLNVPESEEAYFASLSGNMRSNLRRRLKRAKNLRVDIRQSCEGLEDEIYKLRESTLQRAAVDFAHFAEVTPDYFPNVLSEMGDNARLLTYWLEDQLLGFSLVVFNEHAMVQNYNGMRYPEGPDNGLFYLDWMTQLRQCMELGVPVMHSGITTYLIKARLGSHFHRRYLYVRHRYKSINAVLKSVVPTVSLEKNDPGLIELGADAPFAEAPAMAQTVS